MANAKSHATFIKPSGVGFDNAPCQSVSVTTNTPRNPLAALGYQGNVGFIDQPNTADVTIEEFIPADVTMFQDADIATKPSGVTSLSQIAVEDDANPSGVEIAGAVGCQLTGVTFNFTAGQPGRVTWSFLGKGGLAAIDETTPISGTGEDFRVLLWEDVNIVSGSLNNALSTAVTEKGVQSATFNGTINKDSLFSLGVEGVFQYVTTFPVNVTVSLESYAPLVTNPATASGNIAVGPVLALTCKPTSAGESITVGGFKQVTQQYTAADLWWYGTPNGVIH